MFLFTHLTILIASVVVVFASDNESFGCGKGLFSACDDQGRRLQFKGEDDPTEDVIRSAYLLEHNNAREAENVAEGSSLIPLEWNETLAAFAQAHVEKCVFENSVRKINDEWIGENMYIRTSPTVEAAVVLETWYMDQKADYDFGANTCSQRCAEYLQVVWEDTTQVGCGVTTCAALDVLDQTWQNAAYVSCTYYPAGALSGMRPYELT